MTTVTSLMRASMPNARASCSVVLRSTARSYDDDSRPGRRLTGIKRIRRKKMSEILVGVDGTAGAEDALAFAKRLADGTGATLFPVTASAEDGMSPPHVLHQLA